MLQNRGAACVISKMIRQFVAILFLSNNVEILDLISLQKVITSSFFMLFANFIRLITFNEKCMGLTFSIPTRVQSPMASEVVNRGKLGAKCVVSVFLHKLVVV